MADKRVAETPLDRVGEGVQLAARQIERGNDLLAQQAIDEIGNGRIRHRLADALQTGLKRHRHHRGVGAIKDRHLLRLPRRDVMHQPHLRRQRIELQLIEQRARPLQNELVVDLARHQKTIFIAELSGERLALLREAGHDTVHQRVVKHAVLRHPGGEAFRQLPVARIAQHQLAQRVAVMVDQLAGDDQPAFVFCAAKVFKARPQQLRQLTGKAGCGRIRQTIRFDKGDARFGGVGEDEPHLRRARQRQKILVLDVRLDLAIQAADQARFANALALLVKPADERGIEPVLLIQAVADGPVARPYHHHAHVGALVLV